MRCIPRDPMMIWRPESGAEAVPLTRSAKNDPLAPSVTRCRWAGAGVSPLPICRTQPNFQHGRPCLPSHLCSRQTGRYITQVPPSTSVPSSAELGTNCLGSAVVHNLIPTTPTSIPIPPAHLSSSAFYVVAAHSLRDRPTAHRLRRLDSLDATPARPFESWTNKSACSLSASRRP